jgi:hypothetical protein
MIATAWDTPSGTGPQQEVGLTEEVQLAGKLHIERLELAQKIERLKMFITMDAKFKDVEYSHKRLLEDQLRAMTRYEEVLVERLVLLNQPNQN